MGEAKKKIDPKILARVKRVSGREVSRDIQGAVAVQNPAQILKQLGRLPQIVSGTILAGPPTRLTVLTSL